MTAPPSAILLDLDGTLVDSRPGILASCRAALLALGHQPAASLDETVAIGPPMDEVMAHVLAPYGDGRVADGVAAYREHYGAAGLFASTAYPGIAEALDALGAAGAALYVATSKRTVFARRILDHLGLAGRFAGVYGSEPGGALDRKPDLIAHVLDREALAPGRCVMAGDRRHDIAGARANGVPGVGVLWGYGSRAELEAAGADRLAERPAGLPAAVLSPFPARAPGS